MKKKIALLALSALSALCLGFAFGCTENKPVDPDPDKPGPEEPVVTYFTVTIMDGDDVIKEERVDKGAVYTIPDLSQEGYSYLGCYADADFEGTPQTSVTVTEDVVFYAQYQPNTYTVRFHPGKSLGAVYEQKMTYGERAQLLPSPYSIRGEEFIGWSLEEDGEVDYVDCAYVRNLTSIDKAIVDLYAYFDVADYRDFVIEGDVVVAYNGTSSKVRLPEGATEIAEGAFKNNKTVTEISVPDTYVRIGKGAFEGCDNLVKLSVPFIGESSDVNKNPFLAYVFGAESFLDNEFEIYATVNNGSLVIYEEDFVTDNLYVPIGLKTVVVGGQPEWIYTGAFYSCYGLQNVVIKDDSKLVNIGPYAFANCPSLGYDSDLETTVKLDFFHNVKRIYPGAFWAFSTNRRTEEDGSYILTNLRELGDMPNIEQIDEMAFLAQLYLQNLNLGNKLTTIGELAFASCISFTEFTVTPSVVEIGDNAFDACSGLNTVTINGNSNLKIGDYAFAECSSLFQVTVNMDYFPTEIGRAAFCNELTVVEGSEREDADGNIARDYDPVFEKFRIYVNTEAIKNVAVRTLGDKYADRVYVKGAAEKPAYYLELNDGYAAKFNFSGGWVVYVEDPLQEVMGLNTMFGYITQEEADAYGTYYPMLVEKQNVAAYDNTTVYIMSNPAIKGYNNEIATNLLKVSLRPIEINGKTYLISVAELGGYNKTVGNGASVKTAGSFVLSESMYGVVTVSQYTEMEEGGLMLTEVEAPEGTYFAVYNEVKWNSLYTVTYYNEAYEIIRTDTYFMDSSSNLWLKNVEGEKMAEADITSTVMGDTSATFYLSGDGIAEFRAGGKLYTGTYTAEADQKPGDKNYKVNLVDMKNGDQAVSLTATLKDYFDGKYHRVDFTLNGKEITYLEYYGAQKVVADNITERYWDYKADQANKNTEAYYFAEFAKHEVNSSYTLYTYYDSQGNVAVSYVIKQADGAYMLGNLVYAEGGYQFVFDGGTETASFIEGDMRGSFTVGGTEYLVYESDEGYNYYLMENFYGTILYYYMIKLDGYGHAYFRDMHDDDIDIEMFGTYYNTGKYLLTDEYGLDYYEFIFTSDDGAQYAFAPDLWYTYEGEYMIDPDGDPDDDRNWKAYDYCVVLSAAAYAEPTVYTVCDDYNYKIAEVYVDVFGLSTIKEYTYELVDGKPVYTEVSSDKQLVGFTDGYGNILMFAVYDNQGRFLYQLEKEGAYFYNTSDLIPVYGDSEKIVTVNVNDLIAA